MQQPLPLLACVQPFVLNTNNSLLQGSPSIFTLLMVVKAGFLFDRDAWSNGIDLGVLYELSRLTGFVRILN